MSPAIAILTARGLRNLTAFPRALLVGVIVVYGLATVDDYYPKEPWREVGEQMSRYARHGEMALLEVYRGDNPLTFYLDTMMPHGTPIESLRIWREHTPDQYPSGIIDRLNRHPTVWLMHWSPNPSAFDFLVQTGHIRTASMAVDHWGNALNTYRYDQLPAEPLAVFSNGMTLHQAVIVPDSARIDLWWSVEEALPTDYTVSAFLLDATGRLVAQHDAYPFENQRATTTFSPGEVVYDPHPLAFDDLPLGEYTAAVQLYTYYDGQLYPPLQSETRWFTLGTFARP